MSSTSPAPGTAVADRDGSRGARTATSVDVSATQIAVIEAAGDTAALAFDADGSSAARAHAAHAARACVVLAAEALAQTRRAPDHEARTAGVAAAAAAAVTFAQAQYTAVEPALGAAQLLFDVGGGSATDRQYAFDRHWRHARTVADHNPRDEKAAVVGAYHLTGEEPPTTRPLAQGLLTDKYLAATIPAGARAQDSAFLSPDVIDDTYRERATALDEIARQRGQSLAQLALQWVLRQPEVSSALIGASSTWQLDHNLKAVDFPPLTDEELALIDRYGVHGTGLQV
ncbi:aldo/keto reductase [Streptomyces sp. NPDC001508]|uniref:aldo/keto reductase n=1 Tax=Streptomyces sp. NPDC001508 TaxID=3154656 RepID=UPI003322C4AE